MGLDVNRVHGEVDEELLCPICSGVLEAPLQAPECEHAFCACCIEKWISRQPTCPVDRLQIQMHQLKPVPRILRNLLARLEVTCENSVFGCDVVSKLDLLPHHLKECEHNPKKPMDCQQGCGLTVPKDELKDHNCIRELRCVVRQQEQKLLEFQQDMSDAKYQLAEQRRDISLLKDATRKLRLTPSAGAGSSGSVAASSSASAAGASNCPTVQVAGATGGTSNGVSSSAGSAQSGGAAAGGGVASSRTVTNQIQDDEVIRWAGSLSRARVTRWGGMISTPDAVLQTLIQRSLSESGCPEHILDELMANAHERRWPSGLLTLELRQMNRRQYEQYVCKRIPNKQAVVVMACDNMHMSDDMILEPGLVMIFAHGIE